MKTENKLRALVEMDGKQRYEAHPNYLTSYDAIIPLIVKWCNEAQLETWLRGSKFICEFEDVKKLIQNEPAYSTVFKTIITKTPEQLADALIRAAGKWEEGE